VDSIVRFFCFLSKYISETCLHHSVANIITRASTPLADSASLHLCIDFVLFFLVVEKNPLMSANKVRHSPFSSHIFAMQMKVVIQMGCVQGYCRSAKKEHRHVRQSTFFPSLWMTNVPQLHAVSLPKK
jgi:hypothetical protein